MSKKLLKDCAYYVTDRISSSNLTAENYIGVDNMLPNKAGVTLSESVPTSGDVTAFNVGDILIGNIRPYFKKIWLATFDGGCSPDVLCIRCNRDVPPEYLYGVLSQDSFFDYDMAGSKGSKMPRGDKNHIMNYPIPILNDMSKIGDFIININAKISNNNRINAELESMAKTIYDYWFTQFDFPDENGKPYKSSGGKMVWNEELKREIPEGWGATTIGSILGDYPKTASILRDDYGLGFKYPIIDQSKDYICGYTDDYDNVLHMNDAIVYGDHTNYTKYVNFDFARGADGTQIINSTEPALPNYILYQQILLLPVIEKGYSRHFKFLKEQYVIVPEFEVSKKYMDMVEYSLLKTKGIITENQQLASLRDWLLPMLMNGQVGFEGVE